MFGSAEVHVVYTVECNSLPDSIIEMIRRRLISENYARMVIQIRFGTVTHLQLIDCCFVDTITAQQFINEIIQDCHQPVTVT